MPHSWALAIFRRTDYERTGLNVLPQKSVSQWIIACCLLTVAASLLLLAMAKMGYFYLAAASILGAVFIFLAAKMSERKLLTAQRLYHYSIIYITLIFAAMIVDRLLF